MDEFEVLYSHWLNSYKISDISKTHSSKEINEIFTLFLILEEGPEFQIGIVEKIECMLEILNQQFSQQLSNVFKVTEE